MPNVIAASRARWQTRPIPNVRFVSARAPAEHDVEIPEQPMVLNEDGTRYLRKREHGNRPLPLSPLMDPILSAARLKHKHPKAGPKEEHEKTEFQKDLERNVYARALATDIRTCAVTDARLPKHFLIGARTTLICDEKDGAKPLSATLTPDVPLDRRTGPCSPSRTYFHCDQAALAHVDASLKAQRRLIGQKGDYWVTLQRRNQNNGDTAHINAKSVVRDPLFMQKVLSALQDEVVDKLIAVPLEFYRGVISPSEPEPESTAAEPCLIDLRSQSAGEPGMEQGPEPPYRLSMLLSEAQLDKVRGHLGQDSTWALSEQVDTIHARLALLKLASHLSPPKPAV